MEQEPARPPVRRILAAYVTGFPGIRGPDTWPRARLMLRDGALTYTHGDRELFHIPLADIGVATHASRGLWITAQIDGEHAVLAFRGPRGSGGWPVRAFVETLMDEQARRACEAPCCCNTAVRNCSSVVDLPGRKWR